MRVAFHFRPEPWTSHLLAVGPVGGLVAVGATPGFGRAFPALVISVPPRILLPVGFVVLHPIIFWPVALAFLWVDRNDRPRWISRHRIQSGRRRQPPLGRAVRVVLLNQLLLLPLLLLGLAELLRLRGWCPEPALPGLGTLALEVVAQSVIGTVVFYVTHRLLHRPWWMKRVHRVHHAFGTTTALASEYAHPVEFAVANFGALAAGALILAPSLASMALSPRSRWSRSWCTTAATPFRGRPGRYLTTGTTTAWWSCSAAPAPSTACSERPPGSLRCGRLTIGSPSSPGCRAGVVRGSDRGSLAGAIQARAIRRSDVRTDAGGCARHRRRRRARLPAHA